ncbi:mitochondrial nicotinamide adenine dinucleotide transporter SLC25A51 [Myxocyprinus asiaticus]|uniref:mitochondrial nicotinamide adenine dinucleotide transporter SLC25A51 n=1 Tax=Myxocyprinus asiaticus TaxID=70543 RepID=UPI002223CC8A|nr:mitochondrial nicotinamide adenine dinucleotide transporter SLC25A51 [Myxocyprinus asiaticus]XP_051559881.1 mitochondrial nicotinamide adenine dinucleotide transporter SLC25A51 [Myxocyprinus asiaticus]
MPSIDHLKQGSADQDEAEVNSQHQGSLQNQNHYLCGSVAAFANIAITFPMHKVLFRQQLFGLRALEAVRQLQKDGLRTLYRGILPPLLQKSSTIAVMFGLYEDFSRLLRLHAPLAPELMTQSVAAILAGTAEAIFTPFERIQTLLQDPRHHGNLQNTAHIFRMLLQQHGIQELYRGLVPILLRNGPSNALFFGLRGPLKELLPEVETKAGHLVNDFLCGGILGAGLGVLFYPLNVVKSHAQAQIGGEFQSSRVILATILKERDGKVNRLFRGVHLNYQRSIISWGIINATYELLLKMF